MLTAAARAPMVGVATVRARSTDRRVSPAEAVNTSSSSTTHRYPATWASGANGETPGAATEASAPPAISPATSPASESPPRAAAIRGATMTVSTTGPGTAWRPRTSSAATASTAVAPAPPAASSMSRAAAPVSATRPHTAVPGAVSPAAHERITAGMSDLASRESMLPAKSMISGSSANCMFRKPPSQPRGRPRSRSAMMFFWTSLVPA